MSTPSNEAVAEAGRIPVLLRIGRAWPAASDLYAVLGASNAQKWYTKRHCLGVFMVMKDRAIWWFVGVLVVYVLASGPAIMLERGPYRRIVDSAFSPLADIED